MPILPDILQPDLSIVFCGMAPSRVSAARGAYYAHPGNRFWPTLHEIGLTPRLLAPEEFRLLPQWGIGLTDVNKTEIGRDIELTKAAHDPDGVRRRVLKYKPRFLATTSKTAGQLVIGGACNYGLQTETIGDTQIFVLPSTSGAARGFWDIAPWRDLAKAVRG
ncbi:MAG: mismatch-specific DNA-glycosylase [Dongiaceae bacterium]